MRTRWCEGCKLPIGHNGCGIQGIGRTNEDDGRRKGAGLREEVADASGGNAGKHLHELGALSDSMFAG